MNQNNEVLLEKITTHLASYGSVLVAYSGGVDSSLLAVIARRTPRLKMLAVIADSPSLSRSERSQAIQFAEDYGIPLHIHATTEFNNPDFISNPHNRCYYCKRDIFTHFTDIAKFEGLRYVLDGQNADDVHDYRPGSAAARELGVRSPFLELGVTKKQIRELSRELGLPTARKPAMACLSSRIPFGYSITIEKLKMIEDAEAFLHSLGIEVLRVRHHEVSTGPLARLEVGSSELLKFCADPSLFDKVTEKMIQIGYTHVCLDMEGYRMGSLHESFQRHFKKKSSSS
ncbi:MAG: ATP-dependent sacrificial sulfur transferase LarE [Limisphaerales bacterium]|jgi:uncharacterized protein|nr:ATP-dependent sacrificial sulfur transferase LarE [Verrucomicrobiota bacterium]